MFVSTFPRGSVYFCDMDCARAAAGWTLHHSRPIPSFPRRRESPVARLEAPLRELPSPSRHVAKVNGTSRAAPFPRVVYAYERASAQYASSRICLQSFRGAVGSRQVDGLSKLAMLLLYDFRRTAYKSIPGSACVSANR